LIFRFFKISKSVFFTNISCLPICSTLSLPISLQRALKASDKSNSLFKIIFIAFDLTSNFAKSLSIFFLSYSL
ncbi:MAG: hypothetical protein QXW34_03105, partial [Candidatus Methanomethyliaceae archaeon]